MAESFSDLNRLMVDLQAAGARVGREVSKVIRSAAAKVERDARAFAPVSTGGLRDSIETTFSGDGRASAGIEARIGPNAFYGRYVEFGTSRMAPSAFMGPALDRNAPGFVEDLARLADPLGGGR